jgi:phage/plasmid-associated DNA primase
MEKVEESADHISKWVGKEMVRYWDWEKKTEEEWAGKEGLERSVLNDRFMEELNTLIKPKEQKLDRKAQASMFSKAQNTLLENEKKKKDSKL